MFCMYGQLTIDDSITLTSSIRVLPTNDGEITDMEHTKTSKKWIEVYIKEEIELLGIKENHGRKPRITDQGREIILSALFNDPHVFGCLRNTWSLFQVIGDELGIPISFKHLQRITRELGIRCKRPKLELLPGKDYEEGKKRIENYKHVATVLKERSCPIGR